MKAELKLFGGTSVIWGRGWDRMEPWLAHFQHREYWLFSVPAAVLSTSSHWEWQPCQTQNFWVTQCFLKAEAISSQAVVSLGGNSVRKWLCTDWLGAWLREIFSLPINCVQLNILYISYKRAFPLQNMSHMDLVRNSSYNPLLLFPFFPFLGFVFVSDFLWVMNWKTYLEEATKTTVYRLKNTAFILLGSWATILLQISSTPLSLKSVSDVDKGWKSPTLLCLHTGQTVQCLFVLSIIFVLFNCSKFAFIFCNPW